MADQDKKIVVVTGCSSGVGLATAVQLAEESQYKVIATMRNLKKKEALEKAAGDALNKSLFIRELDISKDESIQGFMKTTIGAEGRIDILVNNAKQGQFGTFETVSRERMQALFDTNVFGTARITQEVVREMKKQNSGKIFFITSKGTFMPFPFCEFNIACEYAIEGIAGCLAPALKEYNISVTSIQPGPISGTAYAENIGANNHGTVSIAGPDVAGEEDQVMAAMQQKVFMNYMPQIQEEIMTHEEVAAQIVKCVKEENPPRCVQTSPVIEALAKTVLVDPTGEKIKEKLNAMCK